MRRLCCGAVESAAAAAALEWIDDPVGLLDGQPVAVPELLREVLGCSHPALSIEVIHPSWWPARRVDLLCAVAREMAAEVITRPRSQVLTGVADGAVVVEIAGTLVAVSGADDVVAEPRIGAPEEVAAAVADRVSEAMPEQSATVVIDAPAGIGGAAELAPLIQARLRPGVRATVVDQLPAIQRGADSADTPVAEATPAVRRSRFAPALAAAGVLGSALLLHPEAPPDAEHGVTYLMEGPVAVQVPASWVARRVESGPGSARVEVASPVDPQLVLHITQAPAVGNSLAAVAEPLQRGLQRADAENPGVFVDFDPEGTSAGRPAVTYRERRDGHEVTWAVLVDHAIRIGIGCQSGPGAAEMVRQVCEQAVRSAHTVS